MSRSIYKLKLHEYLKLPAENEGYYHHVYRVPGGWIYHDSVFVPWNNEFQQADTPDTKEGANLQHTTDKGCHALHRQTVP